MAFPLPLPSQTEIRGLFMRSGTIYYHPQSEIVVVIDWIGVEAGVRARVIPKVKKRTAAQGASRAAGVYTSIFGVYIFILAPFPQVAAQVIQA